MSVSWSHEVRWRHLGIVGSQPLGLLSGLCCRARETSARQAPSGRTSNRHRTTAWRVDSSNSSIKNETGASAGPLSSCNEHCLGWRSFVLKLGARMTRKPPGSVGLLSFEVEIRRNGPLHIEDPFTARAAKLLDVLFARKTDHLTHNIQLLDY